MPSPPIDTHPQLPYISAIERLLRKRLPRKARYEHRLYIQPSSPSANIRATYMISPPPIKPGAKYTYTRSGHRYIYNTHANSATFLDRHTRYICGTASRWTHPQCVTCKSEVSRGNSLRQFCILLCGPASYYPRKTDHFFRAAVLFLSEIRACIWLTRFG